MIGTRAEIVISKMASRSNQTTEKNYDAPILFGLDDLDNYLTRLDDYIKKDIKEIEKHRPKSISSEEDFQIDHYIDEHKIDLSGTNQILIESALVAFYSYFESQIFSFCRSIESNPENLQAMLKDIKKHNGDIDKYRILVQKHYNITPTKQFEASWNEIKGYHLMRKHLVYAFLSKKNQISLLSHIKSNPKIWYDPKYGSFSISLEYVKDFSRVIFDFLAELDYLVYQKTGSNTLI